MIPYLPSE